MVVVEGALALQEMSIDMQAFMEADSLPLEALGTDVE